MGKLTNCLICDSKIEVVKKIKYKYLVGLKDDYTNYIGYCSNCGFIFNTNPFSNELLAKRYKEDSKYSCSETFNMSILEPKTSYIVRCLYQKNIIDLNIGDDYKSVFEVGATAGYNLSLYKDCGKEVLGIEPDKVNCDYASKKYNIKLFPLMLDEFIKENDKNFDLIVLSHVLEHIYDPKKAIEQLSKINNKYIFIDVPTFDYKFIDEANGMFSDEHINYFTFESLQYLMNMCGYKCISAQINLIQKEQKHFSSGIPCLPTLWEKSDDIKCLVPITKSIDNLKRYLKISDIGYKNIIKIVDDIPDKANIAIWGVGNCFSMMAGKTNLLNKNIVSIYDNDTKKMGTIINNIIITKFDKKDIKNKKIDYILIMSYTGQEAIEKIIKENNVKCNIIKFYDK